MIVAKEVRVRVSEMKERKDRVDKIRSRNRNKKNCHDYYEQIKNLLLYTNLQYQSCVCR